MAVNDADDVDAVEGQILLADDYTDCQFWLGTSWFDVSSLQLKDSFYRAYGKSGTKTGIDFNFCRQLKSTNSPC